MKNKWLLYVLMMFCSWAHAQNQQMLNDSLEYAKTLQPNSNGQIVNPSAVNSSTWSSTKVPTTTPSGMGQFSSPTTSSNLGGSNIMGGLSALGVKAQDDCVNYVPTGDPVTDQRCAAINFMSAHCLTPTSGQNKILGASGASQGSLANCQGTFGAGQSQFDYGNTVTPDDPIFGPIKNAQDNANNGPQNCTEKTVTTSPAQYTTNTCVKTSNVDNPSCNHTLDISSMSVVKGYTACVSGNILWGCGYDCAHDVDTATLVCSAGGNANRIQAYLYAHGGDCGFSGYSGSVDLQKPGLQVLNQFSNCVGDRSGFWMLVAYVNQTCDATTQTNCNVSFQIGRGYPNQYSCSVGTFDDSQGLCTTNGMDNGTAPTPTSVRFDFIDAGTTINFLNPDASTIVGTPTWIDNCTEYER